MLTALLAVIFIALLASAYSQYTLTMSAAELVDAATSVTSHLVLHSLAHESSAGAREFVIDPGRMHSLDFREEIGGENFEFQLSLFYSTGENAGPYGPEPPDGRMVCAFSAPVVVDENNRLEFAKLRVTIWRA